MVASTTTSGFQDHRLSEQALANVITPCDSLLSGQVLNNSGVQLVPGKASHRSSHVISARESLDALSGQVG